MAALPHQSSGRANTCKKLTKRRVFARAASAALGQSTLDGGTPPAGPFYNVEQAACRGLRRCVKPFCNLCDSRWADSVIQNHRRLALTLYGVSSQERTSQNERLNLDSSCDQTWTFWIFVLGRITWSVVTWPTITECQGRYFVGVALISGSV